jgi:hypothetical protein
MRVRFAVVGSSRFCAVGPYFCSVAAALHRTPAPVVGARVVVEDQCAIVSCTFPDATGRSRAEQIDRLSGHDRKRLPRADGGPPGLPTTAGQRWRYVGGGREEVDDVNITGGQRQASTRGKSARSDRRTESVCVSEVSIFDHSIDTVESPL